MEIKNLFNDDRAVSPVIGVILMVAITVILAAVIGTFVLGLGDSLSESAPQATFDWNQEEGENTSKVTVQHTGGDSIDSSTLSATANGTSVSDLTDWPSSGDSVTAGDSYSFGDTNDSQIDSVDRHAILTSDDEIQITWQSSEGGSSSVITEYTVN
ncbi:type IV pilin [Haloparvum sp. AD34]